MQQLVGCETKGRIGEHCHARLFKNHLFIQQN